MKFNWKKITFSFSFKEKATERIEQFFDKYSTIILFFALSMVSIATFLYYLSNGLGVAYNDARSHLDISRRVVENLTPGFSQLGSVWLPLPHLLATLTVWNDFMWHTGLSGAAQSMLAYVATGILLYNLMKVFHVSVLGRLAGVFIYASNLNILYMQSTAMTELLLLGLMTAGVYELVMWHKEDSMLRLIKAGFWIMCSTLVRYDGWFLLAGAAALVAWRTWRKHGYKTAEGTVVLFCTLGGFGIFLWLFWNLMIFKDPLYFALGPYSAHAQQSQLEAAGVLSTKHNLPFSVKTYFYAMVYNVGFFTTLLGIIGMIVFFLDTKIKPHMRIAAIAIVTPLLFNVVALFFGHSVLFVQGLHGNSWFNVRYGLMMVPSIAFFVGYLVYKAKAIRYMLIAFMLFTTVFQFINTDAVTIDDAVVGASGKNVSQVSGWLKRHAVEADGFVLISAASHDAIIFSSGLPMTRYIHEGAGPYWKSATLRPDRWARWIVMRTDDNNDNTWREMKKNPYFKRAYTRVRAFPFADIYEIKPEYVDGLYTQHNYPKLKNLED